MTVRFATAAAVVLSLLCGGLSAQTPLSESRALSEREPDGSTSDTRAQWIPPLVLDQRGYFRLLLNGDTRIRGEMRLNQDQNRGRADDDRFVVSRTRLSADLTYRRQVRVFLEAMDAREIGTNFPRNQENDFDGFHQAFVELAPEHPSPWSVRAGLQEIRLGRERRLFNATNWNNLRRTFAGARLMRRSENWDLDVFVAQPRTNVIREGDGTATGNERLIPGQYVYGAYATVRPKPGHEVEFYGLAQTDREGRRSFPVSNPAEDGTLGTLERYTVGAAAYGPLMDTRWGRMTYGAGGAWQFGHRSQDDIRAWMLHGELAHEFGDWAWKPRLSLDGLWASGDRQFEDGQQNGFNNLYGSNMPLYSRTGYIRPTNTRMIGPSLRLDPTKNLQVLFSARQFWADSDNDGWVDGFGQRVARDTDGVGATGFGHELSTAATYRINRWTTLEAGAAAAVPGGFASRFGRDDTAILGYTQVSIQF